MSWIDIPHSHVTFGVFVGSAAGATVAVALATSRSSDTSGISDDAVVIDFQIAKAFFHPPTAVITGIMMELSMLFGSAYFPRSAPRTFSWSGAELFERRGAGARPGEPHARVWLRRGAQRVHTQGRAAHQQHSRLQRKCLEHGRNRRLWPGDVRNDAQTLIHGTGTGRKSPPRLPSGSPRPVDA
jgi:hypothetical protein